MTRLDSRSEPTVSHRGTTPTLRRGLLRVLALLGAITGAGVLLALSLAPGAALADRVVETVDREVLRYPPLPPIGVAAERSTVLARDGSVLAVLHRDQNRRIVRLGDVPLHVQQAVLATEDVEYRTHAGVNWRAIFRAAAGNLQAGEIRSGASTITQQLVKNVTDDDALTLDRKLREVVYAVELENRLTKDQILEEYLNRAYFGNGIYGIGTAAEFYFGTPVGELAVHQAATLAGLIRSPEGNNPVENPTAAQQRRDIVLDQMAGAAFITPQIAGEQHARPLELRVTPLPEPQNPAFVDYVKNLLFDEPALGPTREARQRALFEGGLTVRTTLDPRLQLAAQEVIERTLDRPEDPLGSVTAVNPATGEILAAGFGARPYGSGPGQTKIYPAVPGVGSQGRQPGSSFKAFGIVAALEEGVSPAYTTDTPSPYTFRERECANAGETYEVGNYSDSSSGVLDMEAATAKSSNTYFAHLVDRFVAPSKLAETATRMGISHTATEPFCSTVLGTSEVFPLDMATAFGTLANRGERCEAYAVAEVRDRTGRVVFSGGNRCERAVDTEVAARATDLLRAPLDSGTAADRGALDRPAAGKTGTTQQYGDAWFVGYIPQLAVASWVGNEQPNAAMDGHPMCGGPVTGGCLPTLMWRRFMERAIADLELPEEEFDDPPPLPTERVPVVTGRTVANAEEILEEAGFYPSSVGAAAGEESGADDNPRVRVTTQDPPAGDDAPEGSAVRLSTRAPRRPPRPTPLSLDNPLAPGVSNPEATALREEELAQAADSFRTTLRDLARRARDRG